MNQTCPKIAEEGALFIQSAIKCQIAMLAHKNDKKLKINLIIHIVWSC